MLKGIPFKKIFTSKPFWSVFLMQFGYNWGFYTLLTTLPTYLDQIQHFNLASVSGKGHLSRIDN